MPAFNDISSLFATGMVCAINEFATSLHLNALNNEPILTYPIDFHKGLAPIATAFFGKPFLSEFNKMGAKVFSTTGKKDVFWPSDGLRDLVKNLMVSMPELNTVVNISPFVVTTDASPTWSDSTVLFEAFDMWVLVGSTTKALAFIASRSNVAGDLGEDHKLKPEVEHAVNYIKSSMALAKSRKPELRKI